MAILIRPIRPEETGEAKRLILTVAHGVYGWPETFEEVQRRFADFFTDIDDLQANYAPPSGLFLVALDGDRFIGTGAVRRLDEETAELMRLWLLEAYQGQGIGYRLVSELFAFARRAGYRRIRLTTEDVQTRAIAFYRRLGFADIARYNGAPEGLHMELPLDERG